MVLKAITDLLHSYDSINSCNCTRLKARTITTIYRILLVQLIRNRLQNHVITTINLTKRAKLKWE